MIEKNLKGYAEVRLTKLEPVVLNALALGLGLSPDAASEPSVTVARILEAKRALDRAAGKAASEAPPSKAPAAAEAPAPSEASAELRTPTSKAAVRKPLFKQAHELNVVCFNALKLRLDREELQEQWDAAVLEFSGYDLLLLSEVRASDKLFRERAQFLLKMLNNQIEDASGPRWNMHVSEPSGPGAPEVHLALARDPLKVVGVSTLSAVDGLAMDHAPMVVSVEDARFVGELRRFNFVSVHMPPKSTKERRGQRDAQIAKLLKCYPSQSELRHHAPFTNQAARETRKKAPYVAHVIGGDWNADAKELKELGADTHGWEVLLGSVRTSSGGKSYDNWLINSDAKDHLTTGVHVLDLQQYANFSRGQQGISDHAPIALRLTEVPRVV
jgi:endonuclease/exonuclease/phosphatase family metal-dependent hydrolase